MNSPHPSLHSHPAPNKPLRLVLASTSTFRRDLLQRLQLEFETVAPDADESPLADETPENTAERLSLLKAQAVAPSYPSALIIGSDQVAYCDNQIYGKPKTRQNAIRQLQSMRGKEVIFHTGLCLLNTASGQHQLTGVATRVGFRQISTAEIERYVDCEDVLNCAGSAKSEGLGISLLDYMRGDDPNALIGLPLIALCHMLRNEGVRLP